MMEVCNMVFRFDDCPETMPNAQREVELRGNAILCEGCFSFVSQFMSLSRIAW